MWIVFSKTIFNNGINDKILGMSIDQAQMIYFTIVCCLLGSIMTVVSIICHGNILQIRTIVKYLIPKYILISFSILFFISFILMLIVNKCNFLCNGAVYMINLMIPISSFIIFVSYAIKFAKIMKIDSYRKEF